MDIHSKSGWPASALSNFAPHPFVFRGVQCNSMEGLLQSFKFDKPHIQVEVCKLTGFAAKKRGSARTKTWQRLQTLWWNGHSIDRHGDLYQCLLDEAYEALSKNESFARALLATGEAKLTHSIGRNDPRETVLTQAEFCVRLTKIRWRLWQLSKKAS